LNAMQEEVAWLKERALHNKAGAIERYFLQNDKMIKQAYIHEWHVFAHMMRKIREVDGVHFARQQDAAYLQAVLADLKNRRLHDKAANLERFFMCNDRLTKQAFIHEWLHFTKEQRKLHEIDGVHYGRQQDIDALQAEIARLKEARLHDKRRSLERLFYQNDKEMLHVYMHEWRAFMRNMRHVREADGHREVVKGVEHRLAVAEALIKHLGGQIMDFGVNVPSPSFEPEPENAGEASYLKQKLRDLLNGREIVTKPQPPPQQRTIEMASPRQVRSIVQEQPMAVYSTPSLEKTTRPSIAAETPVITQPATMQTSVRMQGMAPQLQTPQMIQPVGMNTGFDLRNPGVNVGAMQIIRRDLPTAQHGAIDRVEQIRQR